MEPWISISHRHFIETILEIFEMYRPLLIKNALVDGIFDEDLYQELTAELLKCIRYFRDVE